MKINEFLNLVGVYDKETDRGRQYYVPLDAIIDVFQRNDLEVRKRPSPWSISADISSLTDLGVDEAHDALMKILRKWATRKSRRKHNIGHPTDKPKRIPEREEVLNEQQPLCAEDPDCKNCESDIDCGGQDLRTSNQTAKSDET